MQIYEAAVYYDKKEIDNTFDRLQQLIVESSVIMTTYDKTIVVTHLCVYTIESYVYQTKPPHMCKYKWTVLIIGSQVYIEHRNDT